MEAIKHDVEVFGPSRPTKFHTDYSKQGLGFYLAKKHCACAGLDPSCCDSGWRITLLGSCFLKSAVTRYVPLEGECLGVAWALEQTKYFTLGCPNLLVVMDHKPLCKILGDKAMEDITNSRILKIKERTLLWKFSIVYRPGKLNYFADCTSRNPVEASGDKECGDIIYKDDLRKEVSAVFQSSQRDSRLLQTVKCCSQTVISIFSQ